MGPQFLHWDYWQLYNKITVDYDNRRIYVNEGVEEFNIKIDLYSDLKEQWLNLEAPEYKYRNFIFPIRVIGGDATTEGRFAGDIYFTRYGWTVVVDPRVVKISGALYSDDFDTPYRFLNADGSFSKIYSNEVSNLVQSIAPDQATLESIAAAAADNIASNLPTDVEISDAVWNKLLADLIVADSTGERLKKLLTVNKFLGLD